MHFDAFKYDFWPIYENIKEFYPLGLGKDFNTYFDYPGYSKLFKRIEENIHSDENYKSRWEGFTDYLEKKISRQIVGTTMGFSPSFSAYVKIEESKVQNLTRTKELHFAVSFVGPYLSIIGKDVSQITLGENKFHWITNSLIVSPLNEFDSYFEIVFSELIKKFPEYRLIPYYLLSQKLNGLHTKWFSTDEMTIYNSLFNNWITPCERIEGDEFYGADTWVKPGYVDEPGKWTVYPPGSI